jgi:hypothetical protein
MAERDPRVDPRQGDILRKGNETRNVYQIFTPDLRFQPVVTCWFEKNWMGLKRGYVSPYIKAFRKWASKAEVLHAAD